MLAAAAAGQTEPRRAPDVPYVPTTEQAVKAMLALAEIRKTDVMYDLGCGDGRIVIAGRPRASAPAPWTSTSTPSPSAKQRKTRRRRKWRSWSGSKKTTVRRRHSRSHGGDALSAAAHNLKLRPKLLKDLKPGTRIVSNTFDMGDWKADKEIKVPGAEEGSYLSSTLYLWTVPQR